MSVKFVKVPVHELTPGLSIYTDSDKGIRNVGRILQIGSGCDAHHRHAVMLGASSIACFDTAGHFLTPE